MAVLWTADTPRTPGRARIALGDGLARTTILTRLYEKGVVERRRQGRGRACCSVQDAPGLTARRVHSGLDRDTGRETVLARFAARLSPDGERIPRDLLGLGER
jgi:predicted transcriptional regulator